ncbi:methyltransferase domain-containing protein [Rhizobium leguminosarum]|uniref:class I SAM-dependent methyltransferase n=1 Tax=Rhizobium ruizarguesonis TaxID=2081791 RepID=UPI0013BCCFAA|nr:methyltransferase domain-containing protein [Rhizobium leguminosarum]
MNYDARIEKIEHTFQEEAENWDRLTRRYQTRYDEMLGDLLIRTRVSKSARILDLGSGSGVLAEFLLERFPDSRVTLLDISSNMLEVASRRLSRFPGRASFVQGLFETMPEGPYDAVVSTLALHHLEGDDAKKQQYQRIFNALVPGGHFWQGEYALASHPDDSAHNEQAWADWLVEQGFSDDEVLELKERVRNNDRPATLTDHLRWLDEIGFTQVDCTWRYIKFAVFGGRKPL